MNPIDVTIHADLSFSSGLFSDQVASSITDTPISPIILDITQELTQSGNSLCTLTNLPAVSIASTHVYSDNTCGCAPEGTCVDSVCQCQPSYAGSLCQYTSQQFS